MIYTVLAIHCAMSIREEVSEVDGVEDVGVDLDTKMVTVRGSALDDTPASCCHRRSRASPRTYRARARVHHLTMPAPRTLTSA